MALDFSASFFTASIWNQTVKSMTRISNSIETSCLDQVVQGTNVVRNMDVSIKNTSCGDISIVDQAVVYEASCVNDSVIQSASEQLANAVGGARAGLGSATGELDVFGLDISNQSTDIQTEIKNHLSSTCGGGGESNNIVDGVSIDMAEVDCDALNVIRQNSTQTVECVLSNYQDVINKNTALQTRENSSGLTFESFATSLAGLLAGILLLIGLCVGGYFLWKRSQSKPANAAGGGRPAPPPPGARAMPVPPPGAGAVPVPPPGAGAVPVPPPGAGAVPVPPPGAGAVPVPPPGVGAMPVPGHHFAPTAVSVPSYSPGMASGLMTKGMGAPGSVALNLSFHSAQAYPRSAARVVRRASRQKHAPKM